VAAPTMKRGKKKIPISPTTTTGGKVFQPLLGGNTAFHALFGGNAPGAELCEKRRARFGRRKREYQEGHLISPVLVGKWACEKRNRGAASRGPFRTEVEERQGEGKRKPEIDFRGKETKFITPAQGGLKRTNREKGKIDGVRNFQYRLRFLHPMRKKGGGEEQEKGRARRRDGGGKRRLSTFRLREEGPMGDLRRGGIGARATGRPPILLSSGKARREWGVFPPSRREEPHRGEKKRSYERGRKEESITFNPVKSINLEILSEEVVGGWISRIYLRGKTINHNGKEKRGAS